MPYLMHCMNKGCYKEQVPLLDVKSNLVMCSECNKEILNVTCNLAKRFHRSLCEFGNVQNFFIAF